MTYASSAGITRCTDCIAGKYSKTTGSSIAYCTAQSSTSSSSITTTECDKCCDTGCQRMNGDGESCERDAKAGIGCASTCWCKCQWYYGGNCDSASQGLRL
jgi:hypothetical protein